LSMARRRLVGTTFNDVLLVYGRDFSGYTRLSMPASSGELLHAVETAHTTFIVLSNSPLTHISEVNLYGVVKRSVTLEQSLLSSPAYFALDYGGRVLLADYAGDQIVLLGGNFKVERKLLDRKHNQLVVAPSRVCLVETYGQLIVASSSSLQAFSVYSRSKMTHCR